DPSIWTNPSPEELRMVGDLEPDALCRPASTADSNQSLDPQAAARYNEAMNRLTRAWDAVDVHGGGRRAASASASAAATNSSSDELGLGGREHMMAEAEAELSERAPR
ncbi:unnamed protein product, partial [Laminaria digitata]